MVELGSYDCWFIFLFLELFIFYSKNAYMNKLQVSHLTFFFDEKAYTKDNQIQSLKNLLEANRFIANIFY